MPSFFPTLHSVYAFIIRVDKRDKSCTIREKGAFGKFANLLNQTTRRHVQQDRNVETHRLLNATRSWSTVSFVLYIDN
jgi:hypothetical protein